MDTICLDFAKAFDNVDHLILRAKLVMYWFEGNPLKLLSYLIDRNRIVNIKGDKSAAVKISSGVPQGSIC